MIAHGVEKLVRKDTIDLRMNINYIKQRNVSINWMEMSICHQKVISITCMYVNISV
jgi:hypothetical protein